MTIGVPTLSARTQYLDLGENLDVYQVVGVGGAVLSAENITGVSYGTLMAKDAQTAHAGGGQANGVVIVAPITRFSVVASAGDSATLPHALPGMTITIINTTATSMNVFPALGETIQGGAANAQQAVPATTATIFYAVAANAWWIK